MGFLCDAGSLWPGIHGARDTSPFCTPPIAAGVLPYYASGTIGLDERSAWLRCRIQRGVGACQT